MNREPLRLEASDSWAWVIDPDVPGYEYPHLIPEPVFRILEPRQQFNCLLFPSREEAMKAHDAARKALNAADIYHPA